MKFFQCDLSQGTKRTRAYIEERAAAVGNRVVIDESGYDGLWLVDSVANIGVDRADLRNQQILNRNSLGSIADQKAVSG